MKNWLKQSAQQSSLSSRVISLLLGMLILLVEITIARIADETAQIARDLSGIKGQVGLMPE